MAHIGKIDLEIIHQGIVIIPTYVLKRVFSRIGELRNKCLMTSEKGQSLCLWIKKPLIANW